jgi:DNA repair protein RadC
MVIQQTIDNAAKVFEILQSEYNPHAEELWGVYLTHHLEFIKKVLVHRGTLNNCRDLFREAVQANSFAIIIAHNHTSGSVEPSLQDLRITKKLVRCSRLLEIPILDHVIFNSEAYYSFKDHKIF